MTIDIAYENTLYAAYLLPISENVAIPANPRTLITKKNDNTNEIATLLSQNGGKIEIPACATMG